MNKFFKLFGIRIPFDPPTPHDQESDGVAKTPPVGISDETPSTELSISINRQEIPSNIDCATPAAHTPAPPPSTISLSLKVTTDDGEDLSHNNSVDYEDDYDDNDDNGEDEVDDNEEEEEEDSNCMHDSSTSAIDSTSGERSSKQKPAKRRREVLQPPNDLPPEFLRLLSPARPVFLYRKKLSDTDVHGKQNRRLLVTDTDRLNEFLTEEERAMSKIDVVAVDALGKDYKLRFNKRDYNNGKRRKSSIVFNREWVRMLRRNRVAAYEFANLWGFRRAGERSTNEFCLAVDFTRV